MPLQLGLAVQIHHLYRSKFLVDTLHAMGFCSSYAEVLRFEKNAADCVKPDILDGDVDLLERLSSLQPIMLIITSSLLTAKGHFTEWV